MKDAIHSAVVVDAPVVCLLSEAISKQYELLSAAHLTMLHQRSSTLTGRTIRLAGVDTSDVVWDALQRALAKAGIYVRLDLRWCAYTSKTGLEAKHTPTTEITIADIDHADSVDIIIASVPASSALRNGREPTASAHQVLEFITRHRPSVALLELHEPLTKKGNTFITERLKPRHLTGEYVSYQGEDYGSCITCARHALLILPDESDGDATTALQQFNNAFHAVRTAAADPQRCLLGVGALESCRRTIFSSAALDAANALIKDQMLAEMEGSPRSRKRKATEQMDKDTAWEAEHFDMFAAAGLQWPPPPEWFSSVTGCDVVIEPRHQEAAYYYGHVKRSCHGEISYHDLNFPLTQNKGDSTYVSALPPLSLGSIVMERNANGCKLLLPHECLAAHGFSYDALDAIEVPKFKGLPAAASTSFNGAAMGAVFLSLITGVPLTRG